jgi:phospholipase/carboxylesterase
MLKNRDLTEIEKQEFGFFGKIREESEIEFGKRVGVILLHGRAGDETLMWVFSRVIQELDPIVVAPRAILADAIGGFSWWDVPHTKDIQESPSPKLTTMDHMQPALGLIENLINKLPQKYGVDPRKIIIIGFSQGGALAITLALKNPSIFLGVGMIASFVPESIQVTFENTDLKNLNIFMSHGIKDEIIPISKANRSAEFLKINNANLEYSTDDVGHKISSRSLKSFKEWISSLEGLVS